MQAQLTEREFRLLSEWLSETYGLCFGPEKRDLLQSRLEPRRAEMGFETFEQLYFHLKFHPDRESERQRLLPHITNNESYFLREPGQLEVLKNEVLGAVRSRLEGNGRNEVRILSAACSTGEEPYSLAIVARDSGVFPAPWRVKITGIDIDPTALARAMQARYTKNAFRRVGTDFIERHFRASEDGVHEIAPRIRERVTFRPGNLVDSGWSAGLPPQDVIFCRNVLIYFDDRAVERAVAGLYNALTPGGYLFLGHAETLTRVATPLIAERRKGAVFYRRPEAGDE